MAVERDLIHSIKVHPAEPSMVHLHGFLYLWRVFWRKILDDPQNVYVLLGCCLAVSLCHCLPAVSSEDLSVSIAAFFSLSPLKNCSFSIWKWDFPEVKTCLVVNLSYRITLKCPLREGDCLSCPTLYHLLLLSLCQVSAEQIKLRAFQHNNGKALSCPPKQLKQFVWKSPLPYLEDANPHQKLVQRRHKQFGKFHVKWQDDDNIQNWEELCSYKIGWN